MNPVGYPRQLGTFPQAVQRNNHRSHAGRGQEGDAPLWVVSHRDGDTVTRSDALREGMQWWKGPISFEPVNLVHDIKLRVGFASHMQVLLRCIVQTQHHQPKNKHKVVRAKKGGSYQIRLQVQLPMR